MAWWNFLGPSSTQELPEIYPLPISVVNFVKIDVQNIYTRILMDVLERTEGIPDEEQKLLWDNCSAGESQDGIVTLLAKAMYDKADLFLVEDNGIVRIATQQEKEQIKADYKAKAESKAGVYVTFKNYQRTDMIKFYSTLEHCSIGGLYKASKLSNAIQLKFNDLRASNGLNDSSDTKAQALAMAQGLAAGKDIMADAKDIIETANPDLTATNSSIELIALKQSFYLGLPASWITGLQKGGLSDSGKADSKAVERGLKPYYFSIIKPVVDVLFGVKTSFKSDDTEMISTANETLKTFELTGDELISHENKLKIVNKLFGLPEDAEGDPAPKPAPQPIPAPVPPKNNPAP